MILREMWGVDPTDKASGAKAESGAERAEATLVCRNGHIKGSLDSEECHSRHNAPKANQVEN